MYKKGYDHQKSPMVDVREHSDGEFVQVWDAPFKIPGRKLLLAYRRNGRVVSDVTRHEYPEKGEFCKITTSEKSKYSFYRKSPRNYRLEQFLDNGRTLVSDKLKGLEINSLFTEEFDFEKMKPKGRKLGDKAVMKLQTENREYYVSTYQVCSENGSQLVLVKRYLGHDVTETRFYDFNQTN